MTGLSVVTGASAGIGRAFAVELAREGRELLLVARDEERLEALARELHEEYGVACEFRGVDLTDREALRGLEAELENLEVEVLVNNAGFLHVGLFEELDREKEDASVQLMAVAPLRLSHAVLPGMIARNRGLIVQVSSRAAFSVVRELGTYAASKAFLNHLTLCLAERLRDVPGVHVHAVCPGATQTEIFERAGLPKDHFAPDHWTDPSEVAREGLLAARSGQVLSVTGEPRRDLLISALLRPRRIWRRVALVLRRLVRA